MKKLSIYMVLLLSTMMYANCNDPKNDFDGVYCSTKVYLRADGVLNDLYDELNRLLNEEEKEILKQSQHAWMDRRNDRCSINTSQGFFINMECATATTRNRTKFFMARVAECESSEGCNKDNLAKILD